MGKIRRRFDVQFKIRICEAIRGDVMSVADACHEYQLSRSVLDRWLQAFDEGQLAEKANSREKELERENEKLKAKVGELTMQIDTLKKMDQGLRQKRSVNTSIVTEENLGQFQKPAKQQGSRSRRTTTKAKKTR